MYIFILISCFSEKTASAHTHTQKNDVNGTANSTIAEHRLITYYFFSYVHITCMCACSSMLVLFVFTRKIINK